MIDPKNGVFDSYKTLRARRKIYECIKPLHVILYSSVRLEWINNIKNV
jgi:hypothetical protein